MDFGKIRADMDPSSIVKFINSTISSFDKVVQGYSRIFKVETKADGSYMCVSGIEQDDTNSSLGSTNESLNGISVCDVLKL